MRTHRFGQKIKLPATIAIKHQIRKLMFEDAVKKAEAGARADFVSSPTAALCQAPVAERPVVLPPENQGANVSCHCYSNQHRHRALGAAPRLS